LARYANTKLVTKLVVNPDAECTQTSRPRSTTCSAAGKIKLI